MTTPDNGARALAERQKLINVLGRLIAHLHVPRSMGSIMVPAEYDEVRNLIGDFGWSSAEEVASRLAAILANGAVFKTAEEYEEILAYIDGLSTALNDYLMSPHADPLKDGHADGFCRRCAAMYEAGMKAISDEDEWTPALDQPEGSAGS